MKTMEAGIGADAVKLAGLQIDLLQKMRNGQITSEHLEWFNKLNKGERDRLSGAYILDDRFFLIDIFRLTIPANYDHATQLASFAAENRSKFYFYNDAITDTNYAGVTNCLVPGKTYEAKIFGIKSGKLVSSPECLSFLKTQNAILIGAQGISVTWQQAKDKFPKGKWLVSFDEKYALWKDAYGGRRVPFVCRDSVGDWRFRLGSFGGGWDGGFCLLCLCDVS